MVVGNIHRDNQGIVDAALRFVMVTRRRWKHHRAGLCSESVIEDTARFLLAFIGPCVSQTVFQLE